MPNITSTLQWIPKGSCAMTPRRTELDASEIKRMTEIAGMEHADALLDLEHHEADPTGQPETDDMDIDTVPEEDDEMKVYKMHNYDLEPNSMVETANIFSSMKTMVYHNDDPNDPYVTQLNEGEDSEEEMQDVMIAPNDSILITASTSDEISLLEFQVLEGDLEDDGYNLYTHHDIMLPTFPLAIEWFNHVPGALTEYQSTYHTASNVVAGSFVAVAGYHCDIELWDVDVMDAILPLAILGAPRGTRPPSKQVHAEFHTDSILALSWNRTHANFLASGSADSTVKMWDLNSLKAIRSFEPHESKICITKWNPYAPTSLVTGAFDMSLRSFDSRTALDMTHVALNADPESVQFMSEHQVYVALDDGHIALIDLRHASKSVWTLAAHSDGACSDIALSEKSTTLASVGADHHVKIWNVENKPTLKHSRSSLQLGPLFTCAWCPDRIGVLGVGGARGSVVLDLNINAVLKPNSNTAQDSGEDDSDSDSDDSD